LVGLKDSLAREFGRLSFLHLGYVWYRRGVVKREIGKREYEKRERGEK